MKNPIFKTAILKCQKTVSILKKGYEQERYRVAQVSNSFLGQMQVRSIESYHIAEYRDERLQKPKPAPGRVKRLSPREEKLIMRYCKNYKNPELLAIVILAIETAMRQGEILSLRWENIDLTKRIAHLPDTKNGTSRDVPLTNTAKDTLIGLGVSTSCAVFKYTSRGLKSAWRTMIKSLLIEDLKFHDLRHEAISFIYPF